MILCGDVLDELKKMPDESVQCCVTSPLTSRLIEAFTGQPQLVAFVNIFIREGQVPNPMPESVNGWRYERHKVKLKKAVDDWRTHASERGGVVDGAVAHTSGGNTGFTRHPEWVDCPGCEKCSTHGGFILKKGSWRPRSVITFSPTPSKIKHFATFPIGLPAFFIRAFTPDHGSCSKCGTPWARVIEGGIADHDGESDTAYPEESTANRLALLRRSARQKGAEYENVSRTIGWLPCCSCDEATTVPTTILDPFAGSGTTIKVAIDLGRNGIGIELNPEYIKMAEKRTTTTMGMRL